MPIPEKILKELDEDYSFAAPHRRGVFTKVDDYVMKLRTLELLAEIRDELKSFNAERQAE